ncbi:cytochrome P450 [Thamnocephalis sphaerospora]|uniref:Cytochrome P450 n=1 Tax=Thamnocephalis sphaerospora TaxID=78915 RepID=A0A4P9XJE6_9FUNG|nr:cytochrome P450 [Thamnocephalis sphaerospora]|eukprot:RKP05868.1 cytochrome P450 [Thamnocephalis sphaerospora]
MTELWLSNFAEIVLTKEFALAAVAVWLVGKLVYSEFFSPLAKLPGLRPAILSDLKVTLGLIRRDAIELQHGLHQKYGPILRIGTNVVSVADPKAMRAILVQHRFNKSVNFDAFRFHADNIFSTQDLELHKKLRRLIAPSFSMSAILEIEPIVKAAGTDVLMARVDKHAESGDTINLMDFLQQMTFDVIGAVSLGQSFGLQNSANTDVIGWMEDIIILGFMKIALGPLFHLRLFPKLCESQRNIIEFARTAVRARRESSSKSNDILQRLLDAFDEETGEKLSEDQVIAECIIQLSGGTDTTAVTLVWAMHLLLENPKCMEKLQAELRQAIPDPDTDISYADVKDLPYLDGVLHETLRLRPVSAAGSERTVSKGGAEIAGYYLPEGTYVISSMVDIHTVDDIFPEPYAFSPERWDASNHLLADMKQALLTFSMGPRACIGRNLAWLELRLTLAMLLRRFDFVVPDGTVVNMEPELRFSYKPKDGKLLVRATRRAA